MMAEATKLTPEQEAELRAEKHRQLLATCAAERADAKERMLARNTKRIADLTAAGVLHEGETLEQYDTRIAEGQEQSQ